MGKLFWKFFLMFWLAQLVTMLGVGLAIDFKHRRSNPEGWQQDFRPHEGPRPPMAQGEDFRPPPSPPSGFNPIAEGSARLGGRPPRPFNVLIIPLEPLLAGLLVSLIFAATLAWHFSRPIRSLREGFSSLASGKLETRLGQQLGGRNDEFGDLGRAFDGMAAQLGDLVGAQRRLLHDVSHELRSPLARLQAATGLARQQPENIETTMLRIEREALRMDHLIDELLTLSRLESGGEMRFDEEVDLGELLGGIVEDARFESKDAGLTFAIGGDTSRIIRCRPELLHRAIENLVRNAIKYAPPASTISLTVAAPKGKDLVVRIEDEGPGIPPEELETVFEPFVRSRSSPSAAGHGLGLAIARRVAEAHGGRIEASNRAAGGLCVSVQLPANLIVRTT